MIFRYNVVVVLVIVVVIDVGVVDVDIITKGEGGSEIEGPFVLEAMEVAAVALWVMVEGLSVKAMG